MASDRLASLPRFVVWDNAGFAGTPRLVDKVDLGRDCRAVSHGLSAEGLSLTSEAEAVAVGGIAAGVWAGFSLSAMAFQKREELRRFQTFQGCRAFFS